MADSENVGAINISIGADYSSLQAGIQAAESIAQSGAASMTASFNSTASSMDALTAATAALAAGFYTNFDDAVNAMTATASAFDGALATTGEQLDLFGASVAGIPWADASGQLNLFTDELEPLQGKLKELEVSAGGAGDGANKLGTEVANATPPINQADTSTKDLIQSLVGLGAALAIVRQIQELGTAALEASDQITRAQISLAVLTGSAAGASGEIAKLEALGQQDGLSMPELLTAATRMQALLGAAAPVPALLAQLANSAAVSGQGIDSAANAFDRIATSGTVAARSLVPLGVNLQDIANSFNQLSGTAVATELNVSALMKQLSDTDRIQVLQDALGKLNGVAQQVGQETFGGQWAQLVAQWSQVMASAGQALLPVIDELIKFTEIAIVPFLKAAIDLFNSMPGPVKDVTVGLGLAGFAAIATAGALGTLAIAINGVKGALVNLGITGAGGGLGAIAGEVGEVAGAVGTAGEAAEVAGPAFAVLGASLSEFLIPIGAVVVALGGLVYWLEETPDKANEASSTISYLGNKIDLATKAIQDIVQATQTNVVGLDTAIKTYNELNQVYGETGKGATEVAQALAAVQAAFAKLPGVAEPVGLALAVNAQAAHDAGLAYQTAKGVFDTLTGAYQAGLPVQAQWSAALAAMEAAEKKAADAGAPIKGSLEAINIAVLNAINGLGRLVTSQQLQTDKTIAQSDNITVLSADVIQASEKLDLLRQRQDDLAASVTKGTALQSQADDAMKDVVTQAAALLDVTQKLQQAQLNQGNAAAIAGGQVGVMGQELAQANLSLQQQTDKMNAGQGSATAYASAQDAVTAAEVKLANAQADTNTNTSRSTAGWALASSTLAQAQADLAILTQRYKDHLATVQEVTGGQQKELSAQIASDQENAVAASGLQGLTDKNSLLKVALIQAQAAYDDTTKSYQAGVATRQQEETAQNNLATATKNYSDAVTASQDPFSKLLSNLDALTDRQQKAKGATDPATKAMWDQIAAATSATPFLKAMWATVDQLAESERAAQAPIEQTTKALQDQAAAAKDAGADFIDLSDDMNATIKGITISGGGKTVYAPGQAPIYNPAGPAASLNSQFLTSPLVQPGTTITQQQLSDLVGKLNAVAESSGATGTELQTLESAATAFYAKSFAMPTLADLVGTTTAAASAAATVATTTAAASPLTLAGLITATNTAEGITNATASTSPATVADIQKLDNTLNAANSALSLLTYDFQNNLPFQGQQVTPDQLAAAQAAAATAQTALNKATSGTSASGVPASTSSSAAVDGGVYPDITAHQGAGEVWQVAISGYNSSGGTATTPLDSGAQSALAAASTAIAVSVASNTISKAVDVFTQTTDALGVIALNVQQITATQSKNVTGALQNLSGGSTQLASATGTGGGTNVTGTYLTSQQQAAIQQAMSDAAKAGVTWDGSVPWDGKVPTIPNAGVTSVPGAQSAGGAGPISGGVTLDFRGANFSGANASDIQSMMQSVMPDLLTRAVRDNGGRM